MGVCLFVFLLSLANGVAINILSALVYRLSKQSYCVCWRHLTHKLNIYFMRELKQFVRILNTCSLKPVILPIQFVMCVSIDNLTQLNHCPNGSVDEVNSTI